MRIIQGLNYPYKLQEMVKECYQHSLSNPFETYYFITEHKDMVEQLFFQLTPCLVNIEIMSWRSFLKQCQIENHLANKHVITNTELVYHLREVLNEDFHCFDNHQPYPLIKQLIPLIKDYDLYQIDYPYTDTYNNKLHDFMHLYTSLIKRLDEYTYLSLESLIESNACQLSVKHIYIDADHLYQTKVQNIIKYFAQKCDITVLYTYQNDKRLMNLPYHSLTKDAISIDLKNHITSTLFTNQTDCSQKAYIAQCSTPLQEVRTVVYTIAQMIIERDLHYQDFVIVYPNMDYLSYIENELNAIGLLHDIPCRLSCQYEKSYKNILHALDSINASSLQDIVSQLLQLDLDKSYIDYLKDLPSDKHQMTVEDFKEFFKMTYTKDCVIFQKNQDHIHVCSIEKVRHINKRHIFYLGLNETIFPLSIKDTSLLLDEDIALLRKNHISSPLTTMERLGVHNNDILKALLQPSCSLTFSYSQQTLSGETLLKSSLLKQLENLFEMSSLPMPQYLSDDDYYLKGGLLSTKPLLNQNIHDYIENKNQPISLSKEIIEQLYSSTLSVSQIETYNKCPFLYFIQYGLGLYPSFDHLLKPNELGSLIHYVLSICVDSDNYDIHTLVDEYIQKDESLLKKINSSYVNQYFIKQLKEDLKITLTVLKRQLDISEYQVYAKEKKINGKIADIDFKGFVDRIDVFKEKMMIIDYKSSDKDIDLNLAVQGFNIQMLLYLKMVTETYQKNPGAVLYFNTKKRLLSSLQDTKKKIDENDFYKEYCFQGYIIDDEHHESIHAIDPHFDKKSDIIPIRYVKTRDEYTGHLFTQEQLDHLLEKIEKHIYELYLQLSQGHIAIMPKGSDDKATHTLVNPCHYCSYHSICNFDIFYNDYQKVELLDIKDILGGQDDAI